MVDRFPSLRTLIDDDRVIHGGWLVTPSRAAVEAYQNAGFDYVGVDAQHGRIDDQATLEILDPLKDAGFPSIVRVSSNDMTKIGRALDGGAEAVIVPLVENAEEAVRAVRAARYAPSGARSFGPIRSDLAGLSVGELDERAAVFVMIETAEGLKNAAEITAVPGLTGIYVGPADLSVSLGLSPWDAFDSDQLRDPFATLERLCAANGVVFGAHSIDARSANRWVEWGARLVSVGSDISLLRQASAELVGALMKRDAELPSASASLY